MITYGIISECGGRNHNEDYAGAELIGDSVCFVLADGLGGHGGGAEASKLVVENVLACFRRKGRASRELLAACFEESQRKLLNEQKRQNRQNEMKTTLVILMADAHTFWWGHIGDSRLYYFGSRKMLGRTLDHSVPQMLVAAGEIKEKMIRGHADRSRLLRVMGTKWDTPMYQLAEPVPRDGGMRFLLCSDGFWELIEDRRMTSAMKKAKTPQEWLERMEKEVLHNGRHQNMDNYTAVAVYES